MLDSFTYCAELAAQQLYDKHRNEKLQMQSILSHTLLNLVLGKAQSFRIFCSQFMLMS